MTLKAAREERRQFVGNISLADCPLSYATGCPGCGAEPPSRRRRWCSQECVDRFTSNHWVGAAAEATIRRDGGQCVKCGSTQNVEANHVEPLRGRRRDTSCLNHLDGMETLCRKCHVQVTRLQRWPESVEREARKTEVDDEEHRMNPSLPGMAT